MDPFAFAADLLDPPKVVSRWYCDLPDCDGEPHPGFHWCEHPLPHPKGDEFWRCRHARVNQRPPTGEWRIWLLLAGRGFGKLLSVDTPIPTPDGWSTMGQLRVGDTVFDEAGKTCKVTAVFDDIPERSYRLTFSDGTTLKAGGEHQWVTWTHAERKAYLRSPYETDHSVFPTNWPVWRVSRQLGSQKDQESVEQALQLVAAGFSERKAAKTVGLARNTVAKYRKGWVTRRPAVQADSCGPQIRTTDAIRASLTYGKREDRNHCIPTCGPLELTDKLFSVDPYLLGYWLGDGSKSSGVITADLADQKHLYAQIELAGLEAHATKDPKTVSISNLLPKLRELGVLYNKHVPDEFLRGSTKQRTALLRGLMDSDGFASPASNVEFCNTNERLVDAVVELARSLGQKPSKVESRATLYGKDCGPKWRVTWRPTIVPFLLPRKAKLVKLGGSQNLRNQHRMITKIATIPLLPMRCITVDSPNSMYLCGEGMIPTHNSRTGAEWLAHQAKSQPSTNWATVAPTRDDLKATCFEGDSGLLQALDMKRGDDAYNKSDMVIRLPNGSLIRGLSAERPERARGPNLAGAWLDEQAIWRRPETLDDLLPALRRADARIVVTTTPRPTPIIKEWTKRTDGTVVVTRGSIWDNSANLSKIAIDDLRVRWEGTRLGRQELYGELLEDNPGALWTHQIIEDTRCEIDGMPDFSELLRRVA